MYLYLKYKLYCTEAAVVRQHALISYFCLYQYAHTYIYRYIYINISIYTYIYIYLYMRTLGFARQERLSDSGIPLKRTGLTC